jgi:hypothetical protein
VVALTALVLLLDHVVPALGAKKCGPTKLGIWGPVIGVFAGLTAFLVAILANPGQVMAEDLTVEARAAYVSQQVEALLRLSSRSTESMEAIYRTIYTALYPTHEQTNEEKQPAGQWTAPLGEKDAETGETREAAAREVIFRITRKVWALSRNTQFYHHESLVMASRRVVEDAVFERYRDISEMLQGQFDSLNGDIEKLRELCSDLGPNKVPLRKLKELAEKTAQLEDQIEQTKEEIEGLGN